MLGSQSLPAVVRIRVILHGVPMTYRILRAKVERPKINRVVGGVVQSVKGYAEETLLRHILTSKIALDHTVAELDARQESDALAGGLTEANPGSRPVGKPAKTSI